VADPREPLGRLVRQTWVRWASEQRRPKRSWLVGWDQLDAGQREVDMRIGDAVYQRALARVMGDLPQLRAERDELVRRIGDLRAFEREYRARLRAFHWHAIDELDGKHIPREVTGG
jgi:uncharacterized membrane protein YccC